MILSCKQWSDFSKTSSMDALMFCSTILLEFSLFFFFLICNWFLYDKSSFKVGVLRSWWACQWWKGCENKFSGKMELPNEDLRKDRTYCIPQRELDMVIREKKYCLKGEMKLKILTKLKHSLQCLFHAFPMVSNYSNTLNLKSTVYSLTCSQINMFAFLI